MIEGPGGGKAQGAGLHGLLRNGGHGGDIGWGGRFAIGSSLAHDIDPQGGVRQLGADVHIEGPPAKGVEIVRKTFPVPGKALCQNREGNVLDTLHQPDQAVVVFRAAGGEADPAIAHDHRRHPVPG